MPKPQGQPNRRARIAALLLLPLLVVLGLWVRRHRGGERPGPAPFDYVQAKAKELGLDPGRVLRFVREEVADREYEGLLRGPIGTLWAGAGNAVDRSALLAALLRACGMEAKLATDGRRWWVTQGEKGDPLSLDNLEELPTPTWTGELPPEEMRGRLEVSVLSGTASNTATYDTAALVHHPLLLRFSADGRYHLAPQGGAGPELLGAGGESLTLVFSLHTPGVARPRRFRREIYTGRHRGFAKLDDVRNVHAIVVAPGSLRAQAATKERELAAAFPNADAAAAYRIVLRHLEASDRSRADLCRHFGVRAFQAEPRVLIGSRVYVDREQKIPVSTLDLRRNPVRVEGPPAARRAFTITRSALEGQLEASSLRAELGNRPVLSALEIFSEHLEHRRASVLQRIALYRDLLERLARETRPGSRLVLALDAKRRLVLEHGQAHRVTVASVSAKLREKLDASKLPWAFLRGEEIPAPEAAVELEAFFGPLLGAAFDYLPRVKLEESTRRLVSTDVRIFRYADFEEDGKKIHRLTLEYQFLKAPEHGDVVYESIDHWDEVRKRPYRLSRRYTVQQRAVETGETISYWYDASRFSRGDLFLMFSRKMVRELKEQGFTLVSYRDGSWNLHGPFKLWLCGRSEAEIFVDGQPRKVATLLVGGGYAKDDGARLDYEKVPTIPDPTHPNKSSMNRREVLDDPLFALVNPAGMRFQTAIPGLVTSSQTGLGVPHAAVEIRGTTVRGDTWLDGRFRLPILKQPFGRFTFRVRAPGYAPLEKAIDLSKADAFPVKLVLEPRPAAEGFVRVDAATARIDLERVPDGRIRDLVRGALEDDPSLFALVPTKPVSYGPGLAYAWLLCDRRDLSFVAVSRDGLYGAAGDLWRWMDKTTTRKLAKHYSGIVPGGKTAQGGAVSLYAGFIASWFAYSAGKLEALRRTMDGADFGDVGHAFAMDFAMKFLDGMTRSLDSWPARYFGAHSAAYRAGFLKGLEFFERNPIYRGG